MTIPITMKSPCRRCIKIFPLGKPATKLAFLAVWTIEVLMRRKRSGL